MNLESWNPFFLSPEMLYLTHRRGLLRDDLVLIRFTNGGSSGMRVCVVYVCVCVCVCV